MRCGFSYLSTLGIDYFLPFSFKSRLRNFLIEAILTPDFTTSEWGISLKIRKKDARAGSTLTFSC